MAFLEVLDSVRDVKGIEAALLVKAGAAPSTVMASSPSSPSPPVRLMDVIPLALLGIHMFYGSGHQSTISSLPWKSAFLPTPTVTYPFSPIIVLNSLGPVFLVALGTPLLACAILIDGCFFSNKTGKHAFIVGSGVCITTALLLGTCVGAAVLRRFAPRFMAAVLEVMAVDVGVVVLGVGVGMGVERVVGRVSKMFRLGRSSLRIFFENMMLPSKFLSN
jgi:phosphatidylinositol glycan class O